MTMIQAEKSSDVRQRTESDAVGIDAGALAVQIVAGHPEIDRVTFGAPTVNKPIPERLGLSPAERKEVRTALGKFGVLKLGGWQAVMISLLKSNAIPEGIIRSASFHQSISESVISVSASELTIETIKELAVKILSNQVLSLCSVVQLKNSTKKHIPLLDFRCPPSDHNLNLIRRLVPQLGVGGGFVLQTARSYHFYGLKLLDDSGLVEFLGRAALFSPLTDGGWIGHQLIDHCCALGIMVGPDGIRPRVVARIDV
jgi:hypothetical protein